MQTTIPTLGPVSWCCRLVSARAALGLLWLFGFAQSGFAQADPPLNFENNFFVTGDYVVAGAQNMTTNLVSVNGNIYAMGTITIPDANPGIQPGSTSTCVINGVTKNNCVPAGAQIVGALLYWQTVEKILEPGSGQNGFFRPVFPGGPQTGYAITGASVGNQNTVSFSSGGCNGSSTGKVIKTYRADVRGAIPQDANGNLLANQTYEVLLPSTGSTTPITLGATLIIIYRVLSPSVPLNAIVIYDGVYAPGNSSVPPLTMTQTMQGFYQAAQNPVSRLTHIVGQGKSKKMESVYLNNLNVPLSSPYPGQPPFPGFYGAWDNPTWTFSNPQTNPIHAGDASATTEVTPGTTQPGCVSWGAVIVSTTVQNTDGDGLLDVWKLPVAPNHPSRPGYCDAAVNEGVCTQGDVNWVDLPNAVLGTQQHPHPDVYVQVDYLCSTTDGSTCDGRYSFNPYLKVDPSDIDPATMLPKTAVQKVIDSFAGTSGATNHQSISLHVIPGNAIPEPTCTDDLATNPPGLCAFPNQPGVIGWPGGLIFMKNQPLNYPDEASCEAAAIGPCIRRFPHGKANSSHYALFGHAVGIPNWTLLGGTLANANPAIQGANVWQTGHTVTFKTTTAHLLAGNVFDLHCNQGRVTVAFALTNPSLNGTYCVAVTGPNTFTIQVSSSANFTYTASTDPNLAVMSGLADKVSGFSDIGGQNSLIGVASWSAAFQTWQTWAGTFMHELGHADGLTHGGFYFDSLTANNNNYTPTLEGNCKANHQSVMNYEFQTKLLHKFLRFDLFGNPITVQVPDFSGKALDTLSEGAGPNSPVFSTAPDYYYTRWYRFTSVAGGTPAPAHCDGSALLGTDVNRSMIEHRGVATQLTWSAATGQDINFDGAFETTGVGMPPASFGLRGHNDWSGTTTIPGILLNQIGATGTSTSANGAGQLGLTGGGGQLGLTGGGGQLGLTGGGGQLGLTGGGGQLGLTGGGGQLGLTGGGGQVGLTGGGGAAELTQQIEESSTDSPSNLVVTEDASPRIIRVLWTPASGNIGSYNIYRQPPFQNGNPLKVPIAQLIFHADTNQFEFDDTVTCNPSGYTYQVSAVQAADSTNPLAESDRIGPLPAPNQAPVTGCYIVSNFSSPASGVQGTGSLPITWTLQDDFYPTGGPVTRLAANTLVAIGPLPGNCTTLGRTTLLADGSPTNGADVFTNNGGSDQFTFTWNNTDAFCAGSYTFELDLDHVPANPAPVPAQVQTTTSPLQLSIDVNDTDSTPHVTTLALNAGTVGLAYSNTLTEDGGTAPFKWTFTPSLPAGISQQSLNSPTLSGTTCAAGGYNFTAMVTDSKSNSGMQALTLQINKANTTTGVTSNANPSVFQQMVTFTVTVAPQYTCTPTGTVTLFDGGTSIVSNLALSGGMATYTTSALSVGVHNITASYGGDANFNGSNSNSAPLTQTVNKANTATTISLVSPSPAVVGQAVTVAYTLAVVPPGAGTPIGPSGNITVTASDGSSCMAVAALGPGACVLSPAATTAGNITFTVTYPGDTNFVASGANGNYTVLIFVSDTAPPPFTATTTLPDATVGVPYNNTVFESGGINDGVTPFSWTIVPNSVMPGGGSTLPGLSFQANAVGTTNGTLFGTPNATGTYTFMVKVTDSKGNFGTQTLMLRVIGFVATGSMTTTRLVHTATLLPSGKVLIAGGESGPSSVPVSSAELYDPATGTFSATGSMNAARSFHTATLLSDGTVLIAGGFGTGGFLASAEIYNPATGVFTTTAGSMARPRSSHTATLLSDGTVLMAGGFGASDATAEIFTPANGTFSATTGNMTAVRINHTATLLSSGKVLLVGGADGSVSVGTLPTLASAELYDPIAKTFSATSTSLTTSRENHTATLLGGSVYFIAGTSVSATGVISLLNSAEVYSASAPAPAFSSVSATLNFARSLHTATLLLNGSVLIGGGNGALSSAELFNPTAQSFTVTGSLATGRQFHTATLLNDGRVLVTGGQDNNGITLASAELYFAALRPAPATNLTAVASAGQVALNWTASTSNNLSYNVYRGTVSGGPYAKLASVATTNFTDTTVASGTTYYYVVTAGVDSNSVESVYSNQVTAMVP